ncbi:MAG TPA: methylmalonyl Co-A mutase-associated GTPase MeaB [Gemmatimonadaceae bacterium]|nr:methylmalonyl Co-A mutase-associated GTPase MeaB [Gemmatimonadaceae bacterium]
MSTSTFPGHAKLLEDFEARRPSALARAISIVENRRAGAAQLLAALHPLLGRARRIGITGPPGAGKSTLTTRLAEYYRRNGLTVGIVAVDPTSPFTGGALLGDRIRMESVALDDGIFIRSMATRGALGGLAAATRDVCDVLDAFGFDRLLVETVGVGQSELDVARTADTSVLVIVPESGDSIQTLKAGLMEAADLFVVNKADRPGADRMRHEMKLMLGLRMGQLARNVPAHHGVDLARVGRRARAERDAAAAHDEPTWVPPVLATSAERGEGIDELATALDAHFDYLEKSGTLQSRRRGRLRDRVVEGVDRELHDRIWNDRSLTAHLEAMLPDVEEGRTTPLAASEALVAQVATLLANSRSPNSESEVA